MGYIIAMYLCFIFGGILHQPAIYAAGFFFLLIAAHYAGSLGSHRDSSDRGL